MGAERWKPFFLAFGVTIVIITMANSVDARSVSDLGLAEHSHL